jgi:acylpyruvate hydrolase
MRLATVRTPGGTVAVRIEDEHVVGLDAPDVGALLRDPNWRIRAQQAGPVGDHNAAIQYAPTVLTPEKIICVGLNYRQHIAEMGRDIPQYPALFAKYSRSLIGAYDDIVLPAASSAVDWEAELGIVIGAPARCASTDQAAEAIAGYTVVNDVTMRDWQYRTPEWLQGKTFEASTPVGPWLVTQDEAGTPAFDLACRLDGEVVQSANTGDLVFSPADLVAYISEFITLMPGDLIATGTPGGVGHARTPPRYLQPGSLLETSIAGVGRLANRVVDTTRQAT